MPKPPLRPPRRPPGWIAPGPRPADPPPPDLIPGPNEDLSYLSGDWRIFQRLDGHRWSADDLLTAWYAAASIDTPPTRLLDLGCGVGSVLLMLAWRFPTARVVGVEAQDVSLDLLRRSLRLDAAEDRVELRHGDLRDPSMVPEGPVFDLVSGTPPYFAPGSGHESSHIQRGPCRFEHRGGVEDYLAAFGRTLRAPTAAGDLGGVGALCSAAFQRSRVEAAAPSAGLQLIAVREVIPRAGKPPLITLYRVRRADAPRHPTVEDPPMVIRGADGRFTADYDRVRHDMGMPVFTT